jgi:histone-lysine N-methyltransferase SETMAR
MRFEFLPHPPYSPDLAPSDYHIFGPLKDVLSGNILRSDEELQEAVHQWLRKWPKEFFSTGIQALVKRLRTCIEHNGDCVEK